MPGIQPTILIILANGIGWSDPSCHYDDASAARKARPASACLTMAP
jgi:hypothetical protein